MTEMSAGRAPRQRISFTDIERQGLRKHHQKYPATSPPALTSWFELQFGRKISVSSVHDILSDKYAYLDNTKATGATRKQRGPQWQDLEDALFRWWQEEQPRRVTGKELKDKANELWKLIPAYQREKAPSFSDGWLTNWRNRHGLAQARESETALINPGGQLLETGRNQHRTERQCMQQHHIALAFHFSLEQSTSGYTVSKPNMMPSIHRNQALPWFSPNLWKDLLVLSLEFSGETTRDIFIPAERVLGVLDLILSLAESSSNLKSSWVAGMSHYRDKTGKNSQPAVIPTEIRNVIDLLKTAELFKLPSSVCETQPTFYEEWFLDYISPDILRSQSPGLFGLPEDDGTHPTTLVQDSTEALRLFRRQRSQSHTMFTTKFGRGGRINIWSRTYTNISGTKQPSSIEQCYTNITITAPGDVRLVPQTVFSLAREISQHGSTLFTPVISFRRTRPDSDEIFRIARNGTSEALQRALFSGEASLSDCDTEGRSLINYALCGLNTSTLKYLLTKIEDPNIYEVNVAGYQLHLVALIPQFEYMIGPSERLRKLTCMNLLLDCGADLSLPSYADYDFGSLIEQGIADGFTDLVKLMFDKGEPFVNANATLEGRKRIRPVLLAACDMWFSIICPLDLNEKIHLLLERGADVSMRDGFGRNCLHLIFQSLFFEHIFFCPGWVEIKDALMCLVTAGADVDACDISGRSVSEAACEAACEWLWIEVLAECGYDPDPFIQYLDYYCQNSGLGAFAAIVPEIRSTRLSFAEYKKRRKSLLICTPEERVEDYIAYFKRASEWKELIEEEDDDNYDCEVDIYSTEYGAEWWL